MRPTLGITSARSPRDIVLATSRLLENFWRDRAGAADELQSLPGRIRTLDDIDRCVASLESELRGPVRHAHVVEDDLHLLLGYLMVASVRGRQLSARS